MATNNLMLRLLLGLVLAGIALPSAADPAPAVKDAVVLVVVRGVDTAAGNEMVATQGTGYFISSEGFLVTAYHLVEKLGPNVLESSITYEIYFDRYSNPMPAKRQYASPESDVMVLYAPIGDRKVGLLKPAGRQDINLSTTPVYVAGYAGGYDYSIVPGVITAWTGPVQPLTLSWSTNLPLSDGQSGAPIVLSNNEVVASAKGADSSNPSLGVVVPISVVPSQYWEENAPAAVVRQRLANPGAGPAPRVVVTRPTLSSKPRERKEQIAWEKPACVASATKVFSFAARPGWEIDLASAQLETTQIVSAQAKTIGPRLGKAHSIEVSVSLTGSDSCITLFGIKQPIGNPGYFEGSISFQERPLQPVEQQVVVADAAIAQGLQVPVPDDTKGLSYFVVSEGSEPIEITPTGHSFTTLNGVKTLNLSALDAKAQAAINWKAPEQQQKLY